MIKLLGVFLGAAVLALCAALGTYWLDPALSLRGAVAMERWASGLERRTVQIPGYEVAYLDSGGSGAPLVLVHGFGADKDSWLRAARPLRKTMRVIALDLPGYGESAAPWEADYTIAAQVENLHAFLAAIGLSHAHLGGHSMGGNIVGTFAAKYPNQVASLWLVAPGGVEAAPISELREQIQRTGKNALVPHSFAQYDELMGWVMARPPPMPRRLLGVMAARAIAAGPLRDRQFAQLVREAHALDRSVPGLPIPTHVLWGAQDRVLHAGGAPVLAALIPGATVTVLPGIGHVPLLEAPEASARDYLEFRDTPRR